MKHIITLTDKDINGSDKLSTAEPRIAVNAVLFDDDGNIAISYMGKYDLHTLPGGGVDSGEDLYAAVKREMLEEAGCDCEIIGELGKITENRAENDFTQERFYYIARVIGDKGGLQLTDEEKDANTDVIWLSPKQALALISGKQKNNYQQKFIQKRDIAALKQLNLWMFLHDIPGFNTFSKIEPINKGWSSDKKYYIETDDGQRMLLRVSDVAEYKRKKTEYSMIERVYELGVLTSQPLGFGLCNGGKSCYSLSGWLDGEDALDILPRMTETEQYVMGLKAGETLRKIHTLPAPDDSEPWCDWFYRKVQGRIDFYNANPIKSDNGDIIVRHLQEHRHLLDYRSQTFCHGDFNISNMIIMPDRQIGVIDFNSYNRDHGDPWWEFDPLLDGWGSEPLAHFDTGLIKGYFDGEPPSEFFDVFSYYLAYDALAALCDTSVHNQGEPEVGKRHMENVLYWLDNMTTPVPKWYLKDFYIQWIDGVPYKLKAPFDFSFLSKYGKVFKVFDDQDSGNICFGVTNGEDKFFVKFAGAPTERANVSQSEAIERMKGTVQIYRDLTHPLLTKLIDAEEIGGGFAMVFEWTDAECMGRQYPLSRKKFMQMPIETRLRVFDDILTFHTHVAEQGYVAIDFYDGCIMYDFNANKAVICDIEFYEKAPYLNSMGRIWGSSRFMSPEEFQKGAVIDEVTNVYTMGATAFAFFGDERNRCLEKWVLSEGLFNVAKKAVNDERNLRQQTIKQFIYEWGAAKQ